MHYLNDILSLDNNMLNESLIQHLLHRLFLPLYVRSLADGVPGDDSVRFLLINNKSSSITNQINAVIFVLFLKIAFESRERGFFFGIRIFHSTKYTSLVVC